MRRDRRIAGRGWHVALTAVMAVSFVTFGLGSGVGSGVAHAAPPTPAGLGTVSQTRPAWCDLIPPPWDEFFPECRGGSGGGGGQPGGEVEEFFSATGPSAVTTMNVNVNGPGTVRLSYPSNLGADQVDHPILVWASGSALPASRYADTLDHLASWGFAVAAMSSPGFGGDEQLANNMRATADYMVAQNGNSSSVFFGNLDSTKVGVFGHSQGAQISALTMGTSRNTDGLIKTAVPFNLPDGTPIWQFDEPVLFFTGTADFLATNAGQTTFFNHVNGPAAKAALVGGGHGGGLGSPAIDESDNPYQGYLVAWFKYILDGDQFARQAFAGSSPEININSAFTNWQSKSLP